MYPKICVFWALSQKTKIRCVVNAQKRHFFNGLLHQANFDPFYLWKKANLSAVACTGTCRFLLLFATELRLTVSPSLQCVRCSLHTARASILMPLVH